MSRKACCRALPRPYAARVALRLTEFSPYTHCSPEFHRVPHADFINKRLHKLQQILLACLAARLVRDCSHTFNRLRVRLAEQMRVNLLRGGRCGMSERIIDIVRRNARLIGQRPAAAHAARFSAGRCPRGTFRTARTDNSAGTACRPPSRPHNRYRRRRSCILPCTPADAPSPRRSPRYAQINIGSSSRVPTALASRTPSCSGV